MDARSFRSDRKQYISRLDKSISDIESVTIHLDDVETDLSEVRREIARFELSLPKEEVKLDRCIEDTTETKKDALELLNMHHDLRNRFPDEGADTGNAADFILEIQKQSGIVFQGAKMIKRSIEALRKSNFEQVSQSIWSRFGTALTKVTGMVIPGLQDVMTIMRHLGESLQRTVGPKRKICISISERLADCSDNMHSVLACQKSVDDTLKIGYTWLDQICEENEARGGTPAAG
ncbi:hypothetical protein FRC09_009136 [Ceratobasidium sp. 395]|nr:hypothetical protein FRC09_009136 [Ceratobasidium sp. 395]